MALVQHKLSLEITPGTPEPVLTVSEYDVNREINILLVQDGAPFEVPSGTTAKIEGTIGKNGFSVDANVSGSTVTFTLTESMTAVLGRVWVKVKLINDDKPISTCAFIMIVDRAGIEPGTVVTAEGFEDKLYSVINTYLEGKDVSVIPGPEGKQGKEGKKGDKGDPGQSAYELAVEEGYTGTKQDWLDSLQGADGKNYGIIVDGSEENVLEFKTIEANDIYNIDRACVKTTISASFEQGGLNSSTGQKTTQNHSQYYKRIRTKNAIESGSYGIEIVPIDGYKYYVYEYTDTAIGTFVKSNGWYSEKRIFSGSDYYRFVLAEQNDEEITPEDASGTIIRSISTTDTTLSIEGKAADAAAVGAAINAMGATDTTLSIEGKAADAAAVGSNALLYRRQLTASDTLDNIFENGIYRARSSSRPADSPTIHPFVMYIMGAPANENQKVAFLINDNQTCYIRHKDSGATEKWGDWVELARRDKVDELKSSFQSLYNDNLLIDDLVKGVRNSTGGITSSSNGITPKELFQLNVGTKIEVQIDGDWVYSIREGNTPTELDQTHQLVKNKFFITQGQYVGINLYRTENGEVVNTAVSDFTGQVVFHINTSISNFSRDIPENIGVANVIRRAYQVVKASFTAESDIPHFGDSIIAKNKTFTGIPYSSVRPENLYVPNCVSIESFMTAAKNPNSYLYTRRMNIPGYNGHCYMGSVCSSFVAWCYGIDNTLPTTVSFASYPGFNILDPEYQNWKGIKLGDAIIKPDLHIYIVTDIYRNRFGEVAYVELSEETKSGKSRARSTIHYRDKITELIGSGFSIYRFADIGNVTYIPSPWVHVDESEIEIPKYNTAIIPRRGDKANWHEGEDIVIDIMESGYSSYELVNNATSEITTGSISGTVITLSNLAGGSYKLRLTGTNSTNSDWTYFDVINTVGTKYEVQSERRVKVTPSINNGEIGSVAFCSNNSNNGADHLAVRSFHVFTDAEKEAGYAIVDAPEADNQYAVNDEWYMRCIYKTNFGIYSGSLTAVDVTASGTTITEKGYTRSAYIEDYPV